MIAQLLFFQKATLSFAAHTTSFATKGWRVFQFLAPRSYIVYVTLKYKSFVTGQMQVNILFHCCPKRLSISP